MWLGIEDLDLILKERRLYWYGQVECSNSAVKTAFDIQVDIKCDLEATDREGLQRVELSAINPHDKETWRSGARSAMHEASQLPKKGPTDADVAPAPAC